MNSLPTGRRGQALALAIAALALALVWVAVISPALDWYSARSERLAEQQQLATRMAAIAATAPLLQQRLATAASAAPAARTMFDGATDAVAGASLQQAVQDIASHTGATVLTAEVLPAAAAGNYRRISVHTTISGSWPVVVGMLVAIAQATPRMVADNLQLRQTLALGAADSHPMEATLTVVAFNAPPAQVTRQ